MILFLSDTSATFRVQFSSAVHLPFQNIKDSADQKTCRVTFRTVIISYDEPSIKRRNMKKQAVVEEAKEEVSLGKDSTTFSILFHWLKQGSMSVYTETKVTNTLYKEPDAEKLHVRICGG